MIQEVRSTTGAVKARYSYAADGTKCAVVGADGKGLDYLGSLVYERNGSSLTLESASFGDGRIVKTSSGSEPDYYLKDHLGSVRVITDKSGTVLEQNDYYPFGLKQSRADYLTLSGNRYRFNGKELQTTGGLDPVLDYGARMYDPKIGRWFVQDPLAGKYYSVSPYVYTLNNPVKYIDPDGRAVRPAGAAELTMIQNTLSKEDRNY